MKLASKVLMSVASSFSSVKHACTPQNAWKDVKCPKELL